jgi:ureidoacrylate peracid hydrolase
MTLMSEQWRNDALSRIDPTQTALLVVDLQKDFCSDEGALAALGSDVSASKAVVERIARFLPRVRGIINLVAFFQLVYDPRQMSDAQKERLIRDGKPVVCDPEGRGCDLVLTPESTDLTYIKHRYSAFSNPEFCAVLRNRSIANVVVTGVDTHICVEGSVRHGYDLGFRMFVLSDLVATRRSEIARHENSLALCERYFGLTVESDAFIGICEANLGTRQKRQFA